MTMAAEKKVEKKMMRDALIEQIFQRMHTDQSIFFLSADFGAPALDAIRDKFKDRFINVGIAEQNLMNIAAGLALEGYTVYAYAIATFTSMRAFEQVRTNIAINSQIKPMNINLVGVGAGVSYDVSGPTHHCFEDLSIMRTLPHLQIFSPSEWVLVQKFVDYSIQVKKPKYMRFDSKPMPAIYETIDDVTLKNGFCELRKGKDLCFVSTGYMTHRALSVAEALSKEGISVGVIDVFLLRPINEDLFYETSKRYQSMITLEEAFIHKGGLDSLVADILTTRGSGIRLAKMGFEDAYIFNVGSRDYLHKINKIDEESIKNNALRLLGEKR